MLHRWLTFIRERFSLPEHVAMILVLSGTHQCLVAGGNWKLFPLLFLGAFLYLFKLRLYDEIKDYDVDLQFNPERPLARGLLTIAQVKIAILMCIVLELSLFSLFGVGAFNMAVIAIAYSMLMFNEFFVKELIRPHLTFYATIHTASSALLSLTLFSALRGTQVWELPVTDVAFSLACWGVFNVFELARKTFAPTEERANVESYSKVWGALGAIILVVVQALAIAILISQFSAIAGVASWAAQGALVLALIICGTLYAIKRTPAAAAVYRACGQAYIMLALVAAAALSFFVN